MDKLQAIHTFVRVAQSHSFTAAAEHLGLPKASVSQRISSLEAHLGVRLLQRTTRRVSLTEDGRAYLAHCLRWLDEIEAVEDSLSGRPGLAGSLGGLLRIDTLPSIARWVIAPALPDWVAKYPQLSLRIGCTDRVIDLVEEGVDCAIRGGPLPDSSLIARRLCVVYMGLYASPAYLDGHPPIEAPEHLPHHQWVGRFQNGLGTSIPDLAPAGEALRVSAWLGAQHDPPTHVAFNEGEAAMAAAVAGLGLVVAPPFSVNDALLTGRLRPVLPHWVAGESALNLVYPSHRQLSPRLRCFVDWCTALVHRHPSLKLTPLEAAQSSR